MLSFCIMAYLAVFAITNFNGFITFCDSDMYADTLIAKLMWEQKTLFPEGWIFGNQLYVFATPVISALFYGITGDSNLAMVLATEFMTLLTFASFFWVIQAFSEDFLDYLLFCLIFLCFVISPHGVHSENAQLFFLQASYYSCYLITLHIVLGDYIRSIRSSSWHPVSWAVALALSLAMGMQSLRQTVIMVLPILLCELLQAFLRFIHREKLWGPQNIQSLIRAVSYGVANLGGLILVKHLHISQTTIFGEFELINRWNYEYRLDAAWAAFLNITKLQYLASDETSIALKIISIISVVLFIASLLILAFRIMHPKTPLELCWLVCLVGTIGVILASILINVSLRPIYLFTWYSLVAFSGLIILNHLPNCAKFYAVLFVCFIGLGNLWFSYVPSAKAAISAKPTSAEEVCSWATENGYSYVYGDWFTAPKVATPSGGKIIAGYWKGSTPYHPLGYINLENIYGPEENASAIYVFTSEDEAECLQLAESEGVVLTRVAEFGDYTAYTSPVPLMYQKPEI